MERQSLLYLAGAIGGEICATSALKAAEGFTRLVPSFIVVVGYATAFYCLSTALKTIPVGLAYAIWSGVGTLAVTLIGYIVYRQRLDLAGWAGIALITVGTVIVNLSATQSH